VYGPGDKDIFILFKMISRGIEAYIGKGEQLLSFIYVKDLAKLTVDALFSDATGETYNITDGHAYGKYILSDLTKAYLGKKTLRFHIPPGIVKGAAGIMEKVYGAFNRTAVVNREKLRKLTGVNWHCDIRKAQEELGFQPAHNLEKGLKETLEWYKEKRWL
jgi:nucleoside-diphosphate-sugar epimerase